MHEATFEVRIPGELLQLGFHPQTTCAKARSIIRQVTLKGAFSVVCERILAVTIR